MGFIFEIIDKTGRKIHLSKESWKHITTIHSEMTNYIDDVQKTIENPTKIIFQERGDLYKYYTYLKHRKYPEKYLRVIVKYLNNHGFVITAHFVAHLK